MMKLDRPDATILSILQADCTYTIERIGKIASLSTNACWRRIKKLEEIGAIVKRVAILNPVMFDSKMVLFVGIKAAEHSEEWVDNFTRIVMNMIEVREFYRMSGSVDFLLKVRVGDIDGYEKFHNRLTASAKIAEIRADFAIQVIKDTTEIPIYWQV